MNRPLPPVNSLVYDEEGTPMRVVGVKNEIATLVYESGTDRGFYRVMNIDDLQETLCEPYPEGTYDVVVEVRGTKTVRVTADQLPALCMDMLPGTATPPVPYGEYMVYSMRPVRIVSAGPIEPTKE